mmetsp:Transcript_119549/g.283895  ORF Transcript_119549/g.283895 Transcript_119549/m.283895 type:complete len:92 (+) Transcript_119549:786-1061(+)
MLRLWSCKICSDFSAGISDFSDSCDFSDFSRDFAWTCEISILLVCDFSDFGDSCVFRSDSIDLCGLRNGLSLQGTERQLAPPLRQLLHHLL